MSQQHYQTDRMHQDFIFEVEELRPRCLCKQQTHLRRTTHLPLQLEMTMPSRQQTSSHQHNIADTFLHQQPTHTSSLSHSPSSHYQQHHAHTACCRTGQSKLSQKPKAFLYQRYIETVKSLSSDEKYTDSNHCCDGPSAEI